MPPDFSAPPALPGGPESGLPLPGATPAELQSAMVWNLRAAMNVAALQCQFSPTLMTVQNYNALLRDAKGELAKSYSTLLGYFTRTAGKKAGPTAFDVYSTRTYNGFSTLYAQVGFCDTAGRVGRDAIGRPKGELYKAAQDNLGSIHKSLMPAGDQIFASHAISFPMDPCAWLNGKAAKKCLADQNRLAESGQAIASKN